MDPDKLPFYLKTLGEQVESRIADAMKGKDDGGDPKRRDAKPEPMPRMRSENGMDFMEPDWEDLDRKANLIIARYTVVSTASNVLPFGLDIVAVTATFSKMATELAGIYQVIVTGKRSRQMGWAIATTTGTVLGTVYAGSRLAKFVPGGYFFGVLVQAPVVGAVAWAAGDTLKGYFKQTRMGQEPSMDMLRDSFARTLRIKLKTAKVKKEEIVPVETPTVAAAAAPNGGSANGSSSVSDVVEKIAGLHELLRGGAITQADFDKKKAELLSKM